MRLALIGRRWILLLFSWILQFFDVNLYLVLRAILHDTEWLKNRSTTGQVVILRAKISRRIRTFFHLKLRFRNS